MHIVSDSHWDYSVRAEETSDQSWPTRVASLGHVLERPLTAVPMSLLHSSIYLFLKVF